MQPYRLIALAVIVAGPAWAAQGDDPDWPCVQRRVDSLSLAVMWPQPVPGDGEPLPTDLQNLAETLALRRVSMDQVGPLVDEAAANHPELDAEGYGRIYAEAFERMDRQRTAIMRGIVSYAHKQAQLSDEIGALREEMKALEAADEPDFDRIDAVETEVDWRERVFDDRNSALTYVCESPVLIERRAYEVAQALLQRID